MRNAVLFLVIGVCALLLVVSLSAQVRSTAPLSNLKTAPERTNYEETSRYNEVLSFLNTVAGASDLVRVTTFGYSFEGRSLPLAVVGRLADARPATVKASGKLRVYIQANVHAGEVEGKEAMLALVREIALGRHSEWLDSIVLLVAPIYNADGNEKVSLTNRGPQHGPIGGTGTRANAQGLNINRDYMKLETPEARSMVKLLNEYDPHVMMDLHTTDGSRHAYYWGIRNRFGILSETYSYATFKDRIAAATRFVEEVLNFARTNAAIQKSAADADARPLIGQRLSLRSKPKRSAEMVEILMGETIDEVNPYTGRTMFRRLDVRKPERMWEFATFESTESERVPSAYFVPADLRAAVERLRAHGIRLEPLDQPASIPLEAFQIESTETAAQAFENHRERTTKGRYAAVDQALPAGTWRVPMNQPLARLAFYLLEPRSNDGLLTWNVLDDALKEPRVYPIVRTRN